MNHQPSTSIAPDALVAKTRSCWLGKMIGGAIGAPFEGVPYSPNIGREDIVLRNEPNDDLELQLLWLLAAEKHGAALDAEKMGQAWVEYMTGGGCDEYGIAIWNLRRGLRPPQTGFADNWFVDGMGAAIRSEIWACLHPGNPAAAAYYASRDATVDHNGDGVWAEMFLAASESAAFSTESVREAFECGLRNIAPDCRLHSAVEHVFELFDGGTPFEDVRRRILERFGSHNFTDCVMNLSFVVAALLYGGDDFVDTILRAVNFGKDTDCTGATAGALWAIVHGADAIPSDIRSGAGEAIAVSEVLYRPDLPVDIDELTERTTRLATKLRGELAERGDAAFPSYVPLTPDTCPTPTSNSWRILADFAPEEAGSAIRAFVAGELPAERLPAERIANCGAHLDLTRYSRDFGTLDVFSVLTVPADVAPAQLLFATNAGITVWIDDELILNYHGMQKPLPAFHRVEGGGVIQRRLQAGKPYVIRVRLYHCPKDLSLSVLVGDRLNHNVLGAAFEIV